MPCLSVLHSFQVLKHPNRPDCKMFLPGERTFSCIKTFRNDLTVLPTLKRKEKIKKNVLSSDRKVVEGGIWT